MKAPCRSMEVPYSSDSASGRSSLSLCAGSCEGGGQGRGEVEVPMSRIWSVGPVRLAAGVPGLVYRGGWRAVRHQRAVILIKSLSEVGRCADDRATIAPSTFDITDVRNTQDARYQRGFDFAPQCANSPHRVTSRGRTPRRIWARVLLPTL